MTYKKINLQFRRVQWLDDLEVSRGLFRVAEVGWEKGTEVRQEHSPYGILRFLVSGGLEVKVSKRWVTVSKGAFFLDAFGSDYHYRVVTPEACRIWSLAFSGEEAKRDWIDRFFKEPRSLDSCNPDEAGSILEALFGRLKEKGSGGIEASMAYVQLLWSNVLRSAHHRQRSRGESWLEKVRSLLGSHLEEELSIVDLASVLGVHRSTLLRRFKNLEGISPQSFRIKKRMEKASRLLTLSEASIQDVGLRCGYDDPFVFSKAFRLQFGLSPRAFRERERGVI